MGNLQSFAGLEITFPKHFFFKDCMFYMQSFYILFTIFFSSNSTWAKIAYLVVLEMPHRLNKEEQDGENMNTVTETLRRHSRKKYSEASAS